MRLAIEAAGGVRPLARKLGIKSPAIMGWTRIPADRVVQVEAVTSVPREALRPDLYREQPHKDSVASARLLDACLQDMLVKSRTQEMLVKDSTISPEESLQEAIRRAGGQGALARKLGIKQQAVTQWRIAPTARVLNIERLTGIRREDLRPDVFEPDFVIRDVSGRHCRWRI